MTKTRKTRYVDEPVRVEDHVTEELKRELQDYANAPVDGAANADASAPAVGTDGQTEPAPVDGRPEQLRGPRKPRDPARPRSVYQVVGLNERDNSKLLLTECKSRRRADQWIVDNASVIRHLCTVVLIVRAREVERYRRA